MLLSEHRSPQIRLRSHVRMDRIDRTHITLDPVSIHDVEEAAAVDARGVALRHHLDMILHTLWKVALWERASARRSKLCLDPHVLSQYIPVA